MVKIPKITNSSRDRYYNLFCNNTTWIPYNFLWNGHLGNIFIYKWIIFISFPFTRKAMCRVYAMQALNWLLRSVTQSICLHDLLWWFITSLTPVEIDTESEDNRPLKREDEQVRFFIKFLWQKTLIRNKYWGNIFLIFFDTQLTNFKRPYLWQ